MKLYLLPMLLLTFVLPGIQSAKAEVAQAEVAQAEVVQAAVAQPEADNLQAITRWRFSTNSPLTGSPASDGHTLYMGDLGGTLYALNSHNGKLRWQYPAGAPIKTRLHAHKKGVIFAAGGRVISLNAKGKLLWTANLDDSAQELALDPWDIYESSPSVVAGTVYIGNSRGVLLGFNLKTGKPNFQCDTQKPIPIRNQPVANGDHIYFGNWEGEFFACNRSSGQLAWQYDTRKDKTFSWKNGIQNRATVYQNRVCFTGRHCRHYCLESATGKKLSDFASPTDEWFIGDPITDGSLVVFGTSDQHLLYARDVATNTTLWQADTAGRTWGAGWMNNKAVYVVNNHLQKFRRSDGKLMADIPLPQVYPLRTFGSYEDARPSSHSDVIEVNDGLAFAIDNGTVMMVDKF